MQGCQGWYAERAENSQVCGRYVARCGGLGVLFGSTGDDNTILLPFMKRGLRVGQYVNIIDERCGCEKVGWPVVDVD